MIKLWLLFLCLPASLAAAEYTVTAKAPSGAVPLNAPFAYQIRVEREGNKPVETAPPNLSSLKGFDIVSQSESRASQMQISNGRASSKQSLTYTYQLQPQREGVFSLKGFQALAGGRVYEVPPVRVTVKKGALGQPSPHSIWLSPSAPFSFGPPGGLFKDFFAPFDRAEPQALGRSAFRLVLNKSSFYIGEMIEAKWIALLSSPGMSIEARGAPSLTGFLQERLNPHGRPQFLSSEVIDGALWRKMLVERRLLFPLRSGSLHIGPYEIELANQRMFSMTGHRRLSSKGRDVEIRPLPQPAPAGWTGAVGAFEAEASLDSAEGIVGKPLAFRLKIKGQGHPHFIKLPEISFPPSVRRLPAAEKSHFSPHKNQGESFKEFEILLIPQQEGQIRLPEFQVSTFDPQKQAYVHHTIPSFVLEAKKASHEAFQEKEEEPGQRFFQNARSKARREAFFNMEGLNPLPPLSRFWKPLAAVIFASLALALAAMLYRRRLRAKGRKKALLLRLKKAQKGLSLGRPGDKAAIELLQIIDEAMAAWPSADGPAGEGKILPPSLRESLGGPLSSLRAALEDAAYSPGSPSGEEMEALFQQAEDLIKRLLNKL